MLPDDHPAERYRNTMAGLEAAPPPVPPPPAAAPPAPARYRIDFGALVFALIVVVLLVLYLKFG